MRFFDDELVFTADHNELLVDFRSNAAHHTLSLFKTHSIYVILHLIRGVHSPDLNVSGVCVSLCRNYPLVVSSLQ